MKNVIITGTSRGIGFELAKLFANKGHQVLALSRNTKPLEQFNHQNITVISVDLSNNTEIEKVTAFVKNNWKWNYLLSQRQKNVYCSLVIAHKTDSLQTYSKAILYCCF